MDGTRTFLASVVVCGATFAPAAQAQNADADADGAAPLFRRLCQGCHGADGRNARRRANIEGLPDFTDSTWHERRTDVELVTSILEGKGTGMPGFRDRLSESQAKALVGRVRAFAPAGSDQRKPRVSGDSAPNQFENELQRLQQQLDQLRRQLEELKTPRTTPVQRRMPPADEGRVCYGFWP